MGHSAKTVTTITEIDTTPEMWGITPMTVRAVRRDMRLPVECRGCYGRKTQYDYLLPEGSTDNTERVSWMQAWNEAGVEADFQVWLNTPTSRFFSDGSPYCDNGKTPREIEECYSYGQPVADSPDVTNHHFARTPQDGTVEGHSLRKNFLMGKSGRDSRVAEYGYTTTRSSLACKDCANGQFRYNRYTGEHANNSTGYVSKMHYDVKVNLHIPVWPEGTTFPSRFDGCDCEACAKTIRKSSTFPVIAQRADGTHVGMFVGNACVTKFGFKKFKATDAQAKSWGKQNRNSKMGEIVIDRYVRTKQISTEAELQDMVEDIEDGNEGLN